MQPEQPFSSELDLQKSKLSVFSRRLPKLGLFTYSLVKWLASRLWILNLSNSLSCYATKASYIGMRIFTTRILVVQKLQVRVTTVLGTLLAYHRHEDLRASSQLRRKIGTTMNFEYNIRDSLIGNNLEERT